jgi:hypothetical protein
MSIVARGIAKPFVSVTVAVLRAKMRSRLARIASPGERRLERHRLVSD